MNRLPLALLLLASTASAQLTVAVQRSEYQTSALPDGGSVQMFVDALGNDNNNCKAAFTDGGPNGPCRQFQAAINKLPLNIRHGVVVNAAAGTYAPFYLSGFTYSPAFQQTTGGLYIKGGFLTVTGLASGTASGTATGGSAGSGSTFGTLQDTTQAWTVNDLRGFFVYLPTGTGALQRRVISSNTTDTITITGTWTAPNGTSTYVIQRPNVIINAAVPTPPSGIAGSFANAAGIVVVGNKGFEYRAGAITIEGIEFTNAAGTAVALFDNSGLQIQFIRSLGASTTSLFFSALNTTCRVNINDSYFLGGTGSATSVAGASSLLVTRVLANGGFSLAQTSSSTGTPSHVFVTGCESIGTTAGVFLASGNTFISGSRLNCSAGTGFGVGVGTNGQFVLSASNHFGFARAEVQTTDIGSVCGTGVVAYGPNAIAILSSVTGTTATTGMMANWGARIQTISGVTLTGGTQAVSLDNGALTGTFADVTAASCTFAAGDSTYGSKVCK